MNTTKELEHALKVAKHQASVGEKLAKLKSNREFKALITDGYLKKEALRLTSLCGSSNMAGQRDEIFLALQAVSKLQSYLDQLAAEAERAKDLIPDLEEELHEVFRTEVAA